MFCVSESHKESFVCSDCFESIGRCSVESYGVVPYILSIPGRLELEGVGTSSERVKVEVVETIPVVGVCTAKVLGWGLEVHDSSCGLFASLCVHSGVVEFHSNKYFLGLVKSKGPCPLSTS